ncbi:MULTISPECIES: 23S rRNA (uridine(2552)-2'-O)-methyltransferase RlmE [Thalassolituus]|jgi:23S rRNA (uridine2552-2'-O)-methyltransferase|uniref:23S rRNA (uridine(2552)-2'-O)-methyltransferase RlmE n=1 Tax=Thalassolituus TaxID=187492 RepID=UPI000C3B2A40|nr:MULTISPECIES: 23S rRNA (uridine(2552)-2'-O)-methyltransferase RlmE [Thalassolituus]MAE34036.1 23S rRNA (uridine(2552)-2'-O)-methyltransferase RlmE [Oceanospirillaceae bacterium]MEC9256325.1 23S rRNA (uridine(2552)-2'-O)-methyltransferase RlmE [Pseudomonadota bacterium]MAX85500.1 23S rRNA (uridine(2552)-2'-O)-methyltransferase RlmE [Oceanospirillaceae bacterium]MDQ4423313.1 23S rRNA (uridine(2552)-2'-O)-methyltransferase RlmE [Thalassolituus sp.]MED5440909.1 23S rRNA (uridine(2552)-2'-O)-met|tara:strand:+ start:26248 stop:26868 length:621 start_codon:yes stop_codon:yes gene_type:complete
MARSKSSADWLKEHVDDIWVQKAQQDGYRTRASYKLIELDDKDKLIRPGSVVVDLGSAPGGWSQVVAQRVGEKGLVIASDILEMDAIADVTFIQGDFTTEEVYDQLVDVIDGRPVDLVISDMAPNMSGMSSIDQPGAMYLVELALDMARQVLKPNGSFVAKVFQGEGFDAYLADMKQSFAKVMIRKPKASRARSREVYIVAKGFRP